MWVSSLTILIIQIHRCVCVCKVIFYCQPYCCRIIALFDKIFFLFTFFLKDYLNEIRYTYLLVPYTYFFLHYIIMIMIIL